MYFFSVSLREFIVFQETCNTHHPIIIVNFVNIVKTPVLDSFFLLYYVKDPCLNQNSKNANNVTVVAIKLTEIYTQQGLYLYKQCCLVNNFYWLNASKFILITTI